MRAAIVGLGSMGTKHYNALINIDDIHVVAVDNRTIDHVDCTVYSNLEDLLAEHTVDFAIVATPTSTHKDIAERLLSNSIHTFIEKPVAMNTQHALDIAKINTDIGAKIAVGHVERFNPAIQALMADLGDQKVIYCNAVRIGPYPKRITDVGVKLDLAIHDIDLISFITGQDILNFKSSSVCSKGNREDTAIFNIELSDNIVGTVFTSWMSPFRRRLVEVLTNEFYYEVDLLRHQVVKHSHIDNSSFATTPVYVHRKDALEEQIKMFIRYIETGKPGSLCLLEDATKALKLVGD